MSRLFRILGFACMGGGIAAGTASFFVLKNQAFLLAVLARLVDKPFEFRDYISMAAGAVFLLAGFLWGALFLGLSEILKSLAGKPES